MTVTIEVKVNDCVENFHLYNNNKKDAIVQAIGVLFTYIIVDYGGSVSTTLHNRQLPRGFIRIYPDHPYFSNKTVLFRLLMNDSPWESESESESDSDSDSDSE